MATKIEWCDETINPIRTADGGYHCTKISPGCANCYAEVINNRFGNRKPFDGAPVEFMLKESELEKPLKWRKPRKIFVQSMGDLFHEEMSLEVVEEIFSVMEEAERHTFLVLTKRPDRMLAFIDCYLEHNSDDSVGLRHFMPSNIWLGVTVENQEQADKRIPILLGIPAAKRFISVEPMLGSVNIARWLHISWQCSGCGGYFNGQYHEVCPDCGRTGYWSGSHHFNGRNMAPRSDFPCQSGQGIDWVICGGETGSKARPMHPKWVESLKDQCQEAGVPFFFKSWGEWGAEPYPTNSNIPYRMAKLEGGEIAFRCGKKKSGRLLDECEWNEIPEV